MLAVIVGSGLLPAALISNLDQPPLVCAVAGNDPANVTVDITFRLETLGSLMVQLRDAGVTQICMVGAIERPQIDPSKIDAATLPLVPAMQQAMTSGDDGAMRMAVVVFEQAGFTVVGAHEIAPQLLPEPGCQTQAQPSAAENQDTARAQRIVDAMSAADIGQCCAVLRSQALAIEGVFGTDWMLQSLAHRPDGAGGVFYKAPKAGQDYRVDLPTIGPNTVQMVAAAGLSGLVIEAGGVLVLQHSEVLAECDRLGLFLWVRKRDS